MEIFPVRPGCLYSHGHDLFQGNIREAKRCTAVKRPVC